MRERWEDLKTALRRMFTTTWDHDDDPPDLDEQTAARTAIVRKFRQSKGGVAI